MYDAACRAIGLTFLEAGKTMGLAAYGKASGRRTMAADGGRGRGVSAAVRAGPGRRLRRHHPGVGEAPGRLGRFPVETPSAAARYRPARGPDRLERAGRRWSASCRRWSNTRGEITGIDAVCLAGGVALNCSANGLLDDPVYVPPVSADAGGALGAAWAVAPPPAPLRPLSPTSGSDVERRRRRPRAGRRGPRALRGRRALAAGAGRRRGLGSRRGRPARARPPVADRDAGEVAMRDQAQHAQGPRAVATAGSDRDGRGGRRFWEGPRDLQRYMLGAAMVTPLGEDRSPRPCTSTAPPARRSWRRGLVADVLTSSTGRASSPCSSTRPSTREASRS